MGVVKVSDIANFLNTSFIGENLELFGVSALSDLKEKTLSFSKKNYENINQECLLLVPLNFNSEGSKISFIRVENPRLAFAKVLKRFFLKKRRTFISKYATIGVSCSIPESVTIGSNTTIGDNVTIGKHTVINHNVVIFDNTIIGDNCYVKSGTVIGEDGFGFDFEKNGLPVRIPHIGNVIIGNNVEVGAKNTIARATLGSTIIENGVKIDDQVHIAHNCKIGENSIITACVEISGSVSIGKNCWIAPNCSIIQKVKIGDNVTIGIGAVITKNIEDNKKIMGFESLDLRSLLKVKKRIAYGE